MTARLKYACRTKVGLATVKVMLPESDYAMVFYTLAGSSNIVKVLKRSMLYLFGSVKHICGFKLGEKRKMFSIKGIQ